jgi:hypothetical protein
MSDPKMKEDLLRKIEAMRDLILTILEEGGPKELEDVKILLDRARTKVISMLPPAHDPSNQ